MKNASVTHIHIPTCRLMSSPSRQGIGKTFVITKLSHFCKKKKKKKKKNVKEGIKKMCKRIIAAVVVNRRFLEKPIVIFA